MTCRGGSRLDLGAWIDDPPRLVLQPRYLAALRELPLEHVAVMIDGPEPGLSDARWRPSDLERLQRALPRHRRSITIWASPHASEIRALRARLPVLLHALGADVVEVDLEGPWRKADVEGFASRTIAGVELVHALRDAGAREVEVTTFPGALPACKGAVDVADRLVLQVYATSTSSPDYDGPLGPRRGPVAGLEAARERHPRIEVCAGLAAYRQTSAQVPSWRGRDGAESMMVALDSAQSAGVRLVRWWSVKHLCRTAAKVYARRALLSLAPRSGPEVA